MTRLVVLVLSVSFWLVTAVPSSAQSTTRHRAPRKAPTAAKPVTPLPPPAPEPPPPPPARDVKVVSTYTQGAQVSQNTTYLRGPRQRVEFPGVVSIDQCDLKHTVVLNPATKKYRRQAYGTPASPPARSDEPALSAFNAPPPAQSPGGIVTLTTTLTDTLERQTVFGLEARRIRTVVTRQATGDACDKTPLRSEIDAWYVDLPAAEGGCSQPALQRPEPEGGASECRDRVETRVVGDVTLGFPVKTVTTTMTGEGDKQTTAVTSSEVTALEITQLDEALFDIPPDFTEARSLAELVPSLGSGGGLAEVLFGSTADGTSAAAPKRSGVIRIGVLEPINRSARSLPARMLRADLVSKFSRPPYEALPLGGSGPAAVEADAARLDCDYILLAEIIEVKTSKAGKVGGFLKMASGGGPPKDSHEVKMTYRLFATGALASPAAAGDAKASTGGFGVGSALRLAAFAGQMYMGMAGMGMMSGFGAMAGVGGLGPLAGAYFDPRAMAMSSMAAGLSGSLMVGMAGNAMAGLPGLPDQSDPEVMRVISEAFEDVAKGAADKLKKNGRQDRDSR